MLDPYGNPNLVGTKDHFHDATRTGEVSGSDARISWVASYYDAVNRPTSTARHSWPR